MSEGVNEAQDDAQDDAQDGVPAPGSAMATEFDVVARWTMDAVRELGSAHAIPAACRGSASPAALAWLGEACELAADSVLIDAGGGMGGPAALAAERFGVRAVVVEPMIGACAAAVQLFGIAAAAGSGARLPLATGSADAVWCLGVLCTTQDKPALLGELRRILRPSASLGLLVFVSDPARPPGAPEGNVFPSADELPELLTTAGFELIEQAGTADFAEAPLSWTERVEQVDAAIEAAHGSEPAFAVAREQEQRIGALLASGVVRGQLLHAVAR